MCSSFHHALLQHNANSANLIFSRYNLVPGVTIEIRHQLTLPMRL